LQTILIPLDNRPVTYFLPIQTGELDKNTKIFNPPREIIGGLLNNTNVDEVLIWLKGKLENNTVDSIVCSLDNIAYGGLIPSRRSPDTEAMILARLNSFKKIIQKYRKNHKIKLYAFSSIMRISNNNINEEEKEYWNKYGELLFKFSYLTHKVEEVGFDNDRAESKDIRSQIPEEILNDYLMTRKRNFEINKYYLSWLEEGLLDYLVYSQDDTAEWGFNVLESSQLKGLINDKNLSSQAVVQTGADEIPTDLIIRGLTENNNKKINIYPLFSTENGKNVISRYEDRTILESVLGQVALCGGKITGAIEEADIILVVHTPNNIQNDHAMKLYPEPENGEAIEFCINIINRSNKPVILADIACANGADNLLMRKLLEHGINIDILYGYAGWNTTGNTLGSAISMGISRYLAEKSGTFDTNNFKKLLLTRLSDDWAYQTVVRQEIRALSPDADKTILQEELKPFIIKLAKKIDLPLSQIGLSFPWDRTFEVEIGL
jgi:hypothetical protein